SSSRRNWATATTGPRTPLATTSTSAHPAGGRCSLWRKDNCGPPPRRREGPMAAEPPLTVDVLAEFGPLKSYPTGPRLDSAVDPDRLVKTHCCFCGQQCGIQLKVKGNEVVGFEPWEDFPFNKGMLCPKGVRRYLQGSHHDRLTSAYFRDPSLPEGFRAVPYREAIQ